MITKKKTLLEIIKAIYKYNAASANLAAAGILTEQKKVITVLDKESIQKIKAITGQNIDEWQSALDWDIYAVDYKGITFMYTRYDEGEEKDETEESATK